MAGASDFEACYRRDAEAILVFLVRRTLDPELALELTAETFALAFQRRAQFRGASAAEASAWLHRIAATVHLKYLRRGRAEQRAAQRLGLRTPSYSEADLARVEELAGIGELRARVAERFAALPPKQRDAVALRIVEELPYAEVAARLGISEQTARARVSRGLRMLRTALRAEQRV